MKILLGPVGLVLVTTVLWEAIRTTLLLQGGGSLSLPLAHKIWQGCMSVPIRLQSRSCLCGVLIMLATSVFWQIMTILLSLNGFFPVTLVFTYLLSVVSAFL